MARKLVYPKFVDHHPAYVAPGYIVTNEEPRLWHTLLGDRKFEKAAGICSGGEVLLSVLVRHAKQIVAVDHSYAALAAAYSRTLLWQKLTARKAHEMLAAREYKPLLVAANEVWQAMPETLKTRKNEGYNHYNQAFSVVYSEYNLDQNRRDLCEQPIPGLIRKAGNITFVHGDLSDLKDLYGTFDLLYTSNAHEHDNRNKGRTSFAQFTELLNPGGLLLSAHGQSPILPPEFKVIRSIKGYRTTWYHTLSERV